MNPRKSAPKPDYVHVKITLPSDEQRGNKSLTLSNGWASLNQVHFNYGDYGVSATIEPYFFPLSKKPDKGSQLYLIEDLIEDKSKKRIIDRTKKLIETDLEPCANVLGELAELSTKGVITSTIEYYRLRHVRKRDEKLPDRYDHRDHYVLDASSTLPSPDGKKRVGLFEIIKWISARPGGPPENLEDVMRLKDKIDSSSFESPRKNKAWALRDLKLVSALEKCYAVYGWNNRLRSLIRD